MADQRPFRFRLPWLSAPVAPALRPTAEPQPPRPRVEIQAPARPITTIPIQRPAFRPAGITPATTPTTQTTAQEQTEPQPMPPRRAAIESQVNSQPVSQSRETPQSRAASVSPSPSRAKTQSQAASQTESPSRATPQSRAASVAPSPSRTTSQPQSAAAVTVPQTQSPSRLATQVPGRKSPQLSSPSKTATQVQPTVSQSPSKKLQLAAQEISQPPPKSTQSETQQEETKPTPAAEPVQASDAVTTPTPEPALETPLALMGKLSKQQEPGMPLANLIKKHPCPTEKNFLLYVGSESSRKDGSVHIHRGYKTNPDESNEATTDGEGSSRGRSSKDLSLSYNDEEPSKNSSKPVRLETRKAEFQVTPAEKLSYEPRVRRRCLRGLFLESSDSDPDNPEKPRRHGCRYSCGQKRKDKDIGVL